MKEFVIKQNGLSERLSVTVTISLTPTEIDNFRRALAAAKLGVPIKDSNFIKTMAVLGLEKWVSTVLHD